MNFPTTVIERKRKDKRKNGFKESTRKLIYIPKPIGDQLNKGDKVKVRIKKVEEENA